MSGFEVDDGEGRWCENCLVFSPTEAARFEADLRSDETAEASGLLTLVGPFPLVSAEVVYDEPSGRYLCVSCATYGREVLR